MVDLLRPFPSQPIVNPREYGAVGLTEKTGKHKCTGCLADVAREEYFANETLCSACDARKEEYPCASGDDRGGYAP